MDRQDDTGSNTPSSGSEGRASNSGSHESDLGDDKEKNNVLDFKEY